MLGFLQKIFGNKHDKDVKDIKPLVEQINEQFEKLSSLSDDELKAQTEKFRSRLAEQLMAVVSERTEINNKLQQEDLSHDEHQAFYKRLEEIGKEEDLIIVETLDEILPEAFATVKEVCRRLSERKHRYLAAGNEIVWDMVPYDVQLIGGIVIHQGKISEMATGEGKTLVAVSPMYLNALPARGVHLVTVNDYLARRDCEWMKPVFDFLEITTGAIQSAMQPEQRRDIYNMDITYGTNNEFGFDYLRDNMVTEIDEMVQRPHIFAIVDEVDSVLIDEARTPLIISGPVGNSENQRFDQLNPRVRRLVEAQNRLVQQIVNDIEKKLQSDKKEVRREGGVGLLRSFRGLPKQKKLQKLLQEPENQKLMRETELDYLRDQGTKMSEIDEELYYTIDEKNHQIDITEKGRNLITASGEDPDAFVIPDIASQLSQIEGDATLSDDEKQQNKDAALLLYSSRSDVIHTISQLLRAYSLYEIDVDYVIQDSKVKIVDEFTGRILEGRRYSDGLHQAIEAKEGVKVERDTQTWATITLQNYFRLYKKLAGMTGTAETEAAEFEKIYELDVTVIPTNKSIVRKDMDDLIYRTKREKFNAVVEEVRKMVGEGRAVLVGTTSVEVSEVLSKMLQRQKINHNVLNAKQHQREAEIVMEAGHKGAVTIATNMAGRGTDIKLVPEVKAAGGLAIIGTERHDARRIDRQLRGRAGRQGDPGSSQFFISLEDDLMRLFGGDRIANIMQKMKVPDGEPIQHSMVTNSVTNAQKKVEENNFGIRKRLLEYDNVMNQQRTAIYDLRRHALFGERLKGEILDYVANLADEWFDIFHTEENLEGLKNQIRTLLLCEVEFSDAEFRAMKKEQCTEIILEAAKEFYHRKEEKLGIDLIKALEKFSFLQTIDDKWKEHLMVMDELKEGIHLRAYGQKDPLLEYKGEAVRLFQQLVSIIQKETIHKAFSLFPQIQQSAQVRQQPPQRRSVPSTRSTPRLPQKHRPPVGTGDKLPDPNVVTVTQSPSFKFSQPSVSGNAKGRPPGSTD